MKTLPLLVLQATYRMRLTKHVLARQGIVENAIVRAALPELDDPAIADIDRCAAEIAPLPVAAEPPAHSEALSEAAP